MRMLERGTPNGELRTPSVSKDGSLPVKEEWRESLPAEEERMERLPAEEQQMESLPAGEIIICVGRQT